MQQVVCIGRRACNIFRDLNKCSLPKLFQPHTCAFHLSGTHAAKPEGEWMSWPEMRDQADYVRKQAVEQFIKHYHRMKDVDNYPFLWGDETETMLTKFDHDRKRVRLSLNHGDVLTALKKFDRRHPHERVGDWMFEVTRFQLETIPFTPFGDTLAHMCQVETNMRKRRERIQSFMGPDEVPMTMSTFPRFGCGNFTHPTYQASFSTMHWKSMFVPDEIVCPYHPRYNYILRNIALRRGDKMHINIPIYKDTFTPEPFIEDLSLYGDDGTCQIQSIPDHIYMDVVAFGSGNCCLQITLQAKNLSQARHFYDQFLPMSPIMMAMSASAPVYRGYLSDIDCRWPILCQAWDDRTKEERGLKQLEKSRQQIFSSRNNHTHLYISPYSDVYNDITIDNDDSIYTQLLDNDVDDMMARHISHVLIRDPIILYRNNLDQDSDTSIEHFDNLNTSYWQSVRLKFPSLDGKLGWRVEFRPLDLQVSDTENAAFSLFIILLAKAILKYDLHLTIPASKVNENMKVAHCRDALLNNKFYFRKQIAAADSSSFVPHGFYSDIPTEDDCMLMSINEIINGKLPDFPGLMHYIRRYIWSSDATGLQKRTILRYMDFISKRASGEIKTTSHNIRQFLLDHPHYQQDSIVTDRMNYDLLIKLVQEESGIIDSGATVLRA